MANEAFPGCVLMKDCEKITLAFETEEDASVGFDAIERLIDTLSSDAARDALTELDQLRDRVKELEKSLLEVKQGGVQDMLAARRVREGGKVDG